MFRNRFILTVGVLSLLLVTLAVSRPFTTASVSNIAGANDFYQRHANWGSDTIASDYYQRHPALSASVGNVLDLTADFYQRHPEWAANVQSVAVPVTGISEASDYYLRHPELNAAPLVGSLETPGLACESPVDCR